MAKVTHNASESDDQRCEEMRQSEETQQIPRIWKKRRILTRTDPDTFMLCSLERCRKIMPSIEDLSGQFLRKRFSID
jgi:hypothetical protein